jgi:hypothetical protein
VPLDSVPELSDGAETSPSEGVPLSSSARARKAKDVIVMSNARNAAANLKVFFIVPPGKMIFAIDK